MNNYRLWLTWNTQGRELKALDVMDNLGMSMTWAALGLMLKPLEAMNNSWSTLWAQISRCYEQLRAIDDMKDFRSWAQRTRFYE